MKYHSDSSNKICTTIMLMFSLGGLGCAQGGGAVATGECSLAIGGPATITVSPELRLSLGDAAIESASRAMGLYLAKVPGQIGTSEAKQATASAIDAAERTKGVPLTVDEKRKLADHAQVAIGDYRARCGKP